MKKIEALKDISKNRFIILFFSFRMKESLKKIVKLNST